VLTVQPMYDGPTRVEVLTPATMLTAVWCARAPVESLIAVASSENPHRHVCSTKPKVGHSTWLVVMFASWSSPCAHFAPAFANLSRKHCRTDPEDSLRFGALDLSLWPGLAGNYGMDLNATSSQLPTVVLFRDGQEVDRLPRKGAKGRWTAADVERVFDLKPTDLAAKKKAA
jgi:thiol-disulfide isomerase/thioredoxin